MHMTIAPSLRHSHKYFWSARFVVNIIHQHDNYRNLQAICFYDQLVQNFATYTRINTVFMQELHETEQRTACGSGWPGLH